MLSLILSQDIIKDITQVKAPMVTDIKYRYFIKMFSICNE